MTPDWLRLFYATSARTEFPHSLLVPALGAGGFGLLEPIPARGRDADEGRKHDRARGQVPGVRTNPVIASVHITNPLPFYGQAFDQWQNGVAAAKVRMADLVAAAGPSAVIVAGDFNSTPDMRQFRDLLTDGYRDAVDQIGAGWGPTFPSHPVFAHLSPSTT